MASCDSIPNEGAHMDKKLSLKAKLALALGALCLVAIAIATMAPHGIGG